MQQSESSGTRRGIRRAAFVLAVGLGPGAVVLPLAAGAAIHVEPITIEAVEERAAVQRLVVTEAVRNGAVPASLALAVVEVESGFVPRTVGTSGAIGLMQILPEVAEREFAADESALWEPVTNLRIGLGRLARLNDRYDGDWELALSHFRGGELRREAGRYLAHGYTLGYVSRVMRAWRHYHRDPIARAWIREAAGAPRFVADGPPPRFEARTAWAEPGRAAIRWESAAVPTRTQHFHRAHDRARGEPCDDGAPPSYPPGGHRFSGGGGRWTPIEGAPSPVHRFLGGRWVAITGAPRFR